MNWKNLDVTLNIARVFKKPLGKLALVVIVIVIVIVIFLGQLCPRGKGAMRLKCRKQFIVSCSELYFARCCAPKRNGTFAPESKVMCFIVLFFS